MDIFAWTQIHTIQIMAHSIGAIASIENTIRVQEWYNFENIHLPIVNDFQNISPMKVDYIKRVFRIIYLKIAAYRLFRSKIIFRNPFKINEAGVSPGWTLAEINITCKTFQRTL